MKRLGFLIPALVLLMAFAISISYKSIYQSRNEISNDSLKVMLAKEIENAMNEPGYDSIKADTESLSMQLTAFQAWGDLIVRGESSGDPEIRRLTETLRKRVYKAQLKALPILRKKYTEALGNTLWIEDAHATLIGKRSDFIILTAGPFGANKNFRAAHSALMESFEMYRFKQAQFEWSAADIENFKKDTPADTALYVGE